MRNIDAAGSPQRLLGQNMRFLERTMERLATGKRINRGSDGPAALISAERLRAELMAIDAESRSMERADAVANVADAGLDSIGGLLAEANALVVANANGAGVSDEERAANQLALDSILSAVDSAAANTRFNGQTLLDGSATITAAGETLTLDRVSTSDLGEMEVDGTTYTAADLGSGGGLNLVDGDLETAQSVLRTAIGEVATTRGRIGSFQGSTIASVMDSRRVAMENLAGAKSRMTDTDYAAEMVNLRVGQLAVKASVLAIDVTMDTRSSILELFER